jgi:hypothetical protein
MATTTTVLTKAEAVRKAFQALGSNATQKEVADYVSKQFGMEVGSSNISQERCKLPKPVISGTNGTPTIETTAPPAKVEEELTELDAMFAIKSLAKKVGGLDELAKLIENYKALVNC